MYGKDKNKKTPYGVFGITLAHVSMSFIIYDSVDSHLHFCLWSDNQQTRKERCFGNGTYKGERIYH